MVSWFWPIGAIVLSLVPTLVKDTLGGNEAVVTAYLAVFSVGIAAGSALAAWLSRGRIILLPAPIGAVADGRLHARPRLWSPARRSAAGRRARPRRALRQGRGRCTSRSTSSASPSPAASSSFPPSPPCRRGARRTERARVIGGDQRRLGRLDGRRRASSSPPADERRRRRRPLPGPRRRQRRRRPRCSSASCRRARSAISSSILFRAFYRLEVKGTENLDRAGPNADHRAQPCQLPRRRAGAVAPRRASRSSPSTTASRSAGGCSPFIKFTRALPLDPAKPMATRTLINAVKAGDHADHLPGRPAHRHRQPDEGL